MKTLHYFFLLTLLCANTFAQVGIGTTTPDSSSILHLESTDAGILIPRLTNAQKISIPSPAKGLLIYQTNSKDGFWYYDGSQWLPFKSAYTFNIGLSTSGNNAQLGGFLIKNTTLDLDNYNLVLETSSTSLFPGEFEIKGKNRTILKTLIKDDYIHFGDEYPYLGTSVDGTSFTTIGGDN